MNLIAVCALAQLLQQVDQRLFSVEIFEGARVCSHGVDVFFADDPTQQQFLIRGSDRIESAPHVVCAGLIGLPFGPFPCAGSIKNLVLHVRVHVAGALRPGMSQSELDYLIGDFLIAFADDHVDRRLTTDKL